MRPWTALTDLINKVEKNEIHHPSLFSVCHIRKWQWSRDERWGVKCHAITVQSEWRLLTSLHIPKYYEKARGSKQAAKAHSMREELRKKPHPSPPSSDSEDAFVSKKKALAFCRLPLEKHQLLSKWASNIRRKDLRLNKNTTICSLHLRVGRTKSSDEVLTLKLPEPPHYTNPRQRQLPKVRKSLQETR
jgi:hypothetical protein